MGQISVSGGAGRCVILSGGDIADYGALRAELAPEDFFICADSGYRHCGPLSITPHLLVGDFDSIGAMPPETVPRVGVPAEKDFTDTVLAAEEAMARGFRRILLAGGAGGPRFDHTLANLQTLAGLSRRGIEAVMTDGATRCRAFTAPVQGTILSLPSRAGCYFSVFALSGVCRGVSIRGGKYPLSDYDLRFDEARAVSNEFLDGGDALITLEEGTLLITTVPMDRATEKTSKGRNCGYV